MDIIGSEAYLRVMLARLVTICAIVAIAVVTTISAAHAARMDGMQLDHTAQPAAMMQLSGDAQPSCDGGQPCGSADSSMCAFVCTGLSVFLAMPGVEVGHSVGSAELGFPAETVHIGHLPGLNERPPRLRLL